MSKQTVGAFLREKLTNMAGWIEEELGKENIRVVLKQYIAERTETEITYVVGILYANSTMITHKDWSGLARLTELPTSLLEVLHNVSKSEGMHEKFWRYMELFVAVISNSESSDDAK